MSEINAPVAPSSEPTTPAPAAPATSGPIASPVATSQVPSAPTTGAPEDRSGWVPPHRLRETREAAIREAQKTWQERESQYESRLSQIQSQLHALVGVTPPQNPEVDAVRQQFGSLYPGLSKLEERAEALMEILERSGELESSTNYMWNNHGRQTMDRLYSRAAESLGGPLNDEAKRTLHASFVGFVQQSPENYERYVNDPTLVDDYWKSFSSGFIDPVRRTAAATVAGRVPTALPQDSPGGAPRPTPAPQLSNLDERANAAWAHYNANAKR